MVAVRMPNSCGYAVLNRDAVSHLVARGRFVRVGESVKLEIVEQMRVHACGRVDSCVSELSRHKQEGELPR